MKPRKVTPVKRRISRGLSKVAKKYYYQFRIAEYTVIRKYSNIRQYSN